MYLFSALPLLCTLASAAYVNLPDTPVVDDEIANFVQFAEASHDPDSVSPLLGIRYGAAHRAKFNHKRLTCGGDASSTKMAAAIGKKHMKESCGKCLLVHRGTSHVYVKVVDTCRNCTKDELILSKDAFKQLASSSKSNVEVFWRFVDCPEGK